WLTYDPDDPLLVESGYVPEESDMRPVEAAPDWLNALVPGLDFSANSEPLADTQFVEAPRSQRNRQEAVAENPTREFNWLVRLVEREEVESDALAARRRFAFTRPPLWLRKSTPAATPAEEIRDLAGTDRPLEADPDWLTDDDNEDFDFS
ncbi:MAG: hypothetical protein ACOYL5_17500, partial [Phototrophicaceae bacterium]